MTYIYQHLNHCCATCTVERRGIIHGRNKVGQGVNDHGELGDSSLYRKCISFASSAEAKWREELTLLAAATSAGEDRIPRGSIAFAKSPDTLVTVPMLSTTCWTLRALGARAAGAAKEPCKKTRAETTMEAKSIVRDVRL